MAASQLSIYFLCLVMGLYKIINNKIIITD